jgi:hypothetical protein
VPKAMSKGWLRPSPVSWRAWFGSPSGNRVTESLLQLAIQILPPLSDTVACGHEMPPWVHPLAGLTGVPSLRNWDTLLFVGGVAQFLDAKPKFPTQMSP